MTQAMPSLFVFLLYFALFSCSALKPLIKFFFLKSFWKLHAWWVFFCIRFDSSIDSQRDSQVEIYYGPKNILKAEKEHFIDRY